MRSSWPESASQASTTVTRTATAAPPSRTIDRLDPGWRAGLLDGTGVTDTRGGRGVVGEGRGEGLKACVAAAANSPAVV